MTSGSILSAEMPTFTQCINISALILFFVHVERSLNYLLVRLDQGRSRCYSMQKCLYLQVQIFVDHPSRVI